jgi:uncharacterized protein (DUF1330 family)
MAPIVAAVAARGGGHMHGFGSPGAFNGTGMHGGREASTVAPAYVLIGVSQIRDADAFKAAIHDLNAALPQFHGIVTIDMDKPISWEGTASEYVLLIQFDNSDHALAWKQSDLFKTFDAKLHGIAQPNMQLVQGLPLVTGGLNQGRGHRGFDQRAFEPNVKEYDQMLSKMHGICKGC